MNNSAKLLSKFAKNGVVSVKEVRTANIYLFKFLMNNFEKLSETLRALGIELWNDLKPSRKPEYIRLYLKFTYGETVNLSDLREKERSVYNSIVSFGRPPRETLEQWGFEVIYNHTKHVKDILKEAGRGKLDRDSYKRLHYRARREGIHIQEYLKSLGIQTNKDEQINLIRNLRDNQGKSFREIAAILNIPKSTVHKRYKESRS